jgi:predicted phage tail protein
MKSKKMRPFSHKVSKKPTHSAKPRRKWWFGILLIVLLIGYLVWKGTVSHTITTDAERLPTTTEETQASQTDALLLDNAANDLDTGSLDNSDVDNNALDSSNLETSDTALNQNTDNVTATSANIPDPKAILKAPLPKTNSLAKEEIDRLEDERKRLAEQEKLAAEQIAMTKQLTELKAQEIALLEQQIAQLEADTVPKTNVN